MGHSQEHQPVPPPLCPSALPVAPHPRTLHSTLPRTPPRPAPRPRLDLLAAIREEEQERKGEVEREASLAEAVRLGQDHLVRRLLEAGVRVDRRDAEGALKRAVEGRSSPALVARLLEQGARVEAGLLARAVQGAGYLGGQVGYSQIQSRGWLSRGQGMIQH